MSDRIDHAAEAVALLNLAAAAQHQGDPRHLIAAALGIEAVDHG